MHWDALSDFIGTTTEASIGVSGIAINPENPDVIYIATGDGEAMYNFSNGVLKSTDGGQTFNKTDLDWSTNSMRVIRKIIIDPQRPNIIFAATSIGIFRTETGGENWLNVQGGNFFDIEVKPDLIGSTYYASTDRTVYKTIDQGLNWEPIKVITNSNRIALAVTPASPEHLYLLSSRGAVDILRQSSFNGIYKSTDSGDNFELMADSPNILGWRSNGSDLKGQGHYDLAITVNPNNANTLYVGGINIWRSGDGGNNWVIQTRYADRINNGEDHYQDPSLQEVHADQHTLEWNNGILFVVNDGGIYKRLNNGIWVDISGNLAISQMHRIGISQLDNQALSGLQDNGVKKRDPNGLWFEQSYYFADGGECIISPHNPTVFFAASYRGGINFSLNSGVNWNVLIKRDRQKAAFVAPLIYDPNNYGIIYFAHDKVFKCENNGDDRVDSISDHLANELTLLQIAPSNSDFIYTGTNKALWQSKNGGVSWELKALPDTMISMLIVHPSNPNIIWVTNQGYIDNKKVFQSKDGGVSWINITGSTLPNIPANCIVYAPDSQDGLYIGMDVGVYYKDNTLSDWVLFNSGLPHVEVTELEIKKSTNQIFAATYGRGLWVSDTYPSSPECTDPFEPNNTYLTATPFFNGPIGLGTSNHTEKANIGFVDDVDWYQLTLAAKGNLTISLSDLPFDYNIELYGPGGSTQPALAGSYDLNLNTQSEEILFYNNSDNPTTYYIKVYSQNPLDFTNTICYSINIKWTTEDINLSNFEYWYDGDYNNKKSKSIPFVNKVNINTNLGTEGLIEGLHNLHLRFRDQNSLWSPVVSKTFIKLPISHFSHRSIVAYEYWFDQDYENKVVQIVNSQNDFNLITNIGSGNLANGLHQFHIRFKDDINQWSSLTSQIFIKLDPSAFSERKIHKIEYWFDNDYANKVNDTVAPENNLNYIRNINTDILSHGLHHLHIRFRDDIHQWSTLQSQIFVKTNQAHIPNFVNGYRYWLNSDTSSIINVDIPITTNPKFLLTDLNLANLDTGTHTIAFQFRDLNNLWSQVILDTFYQLGEPRLDTITPAKGGNIGDVTCTIYGTGFYPGTKVKLSRIGFPDIIVPDSLLQIQLGQRITATFNLRNRDLGFYNLEVEIPSDTTMILNNAFEIIQGVQPVLYTTLTGPSNLRVGQFIYYTLVYGQNGNIDAKGVPIWLAISDNVELISIDSNKIYKPKTNSLLLDSIPISSKIDMLNGNVFNGRIYGYFVPRISPGQVGFIQLKLKVNSPGQFMIKSWANQPYYVNPLLKSVSTCFYNAWKLVPNANPTASCIDASMELVIDPIFIIANNEAENKLLGSTIWNQIVVINDCSLASVPISHPYLDIIRYGVKGIDIILDSKEAIESCKMTFQEVGEDLNELNGVNSYDPNDKIGPIGSGLSQYIVQEKAINYLIHFENVDTATAPSQKVCIFDTIDINVFDISTLEHGFIRIADTIIYFPAHLKAINSFIDLRPKLNYVVKIESTLDNITGILKWTFTTLDPETLMEVTDPLSGFLPPNVNKPEGEGSVFYSIRVKEDVPNNTEVNNTACIIFDNNPSICTNTWRNTIDKELPTSFVKALPPEVGDTTFQVCWQGQDTTSGIDNYDVFYSRNDGPYLPWLLSTKDTCAMFTGQIDSTYQFYSIARDSAGNTEIPPVGYDAITKISCLMPEFICPDNIVKAQTPGYCGSQIFFEVGISEDCAQISISQTQGLPNGSFYPIGKTINKFIATDRSGNTLSCRFTVTIKDTIAPKFNCPLNIQLITKPLECFVNYPRASLGSVTQLSDNCPWIKPNTDSSTLVISNNALATYPLGLTNVLWTVMDSSGNKNTCKQTVTVNPYNCGTPYQPLTVSTTATTGKVTWKAGLCADEYSARIRAEISTGVYGTWSNWIPVSGPGLTHVFTGLTKSKNYNYQLRTKCGKSFSKNANGFFKTKVGLNNDELQTRENEFESEGDQERKITFVPNPASTESNLIIQGFETSAKVLYIIDSNGKLILRTKLQADDNNIILDLLELGLTKGVYHIRIDNITAKCTSRLAVE